MALPQSIGKGVQRQAGRLLTTGNRFKRFDQIRQRHFWSKYRFTPTAAGFIPSGDYDLFQTPVGQAGQGFNTPLTLLETNWPSANRVPDNQNFEITEIGCSAQVTSIEPTITGAGFNSSHYSGLENELLRNLVVSITYLTNTIPMGLAIDFAQPGGPHVGMYSPGAAADPRRTFVSNGAPGPALRRRFKIPILLQHGETFRFTFQVPQGRGPFVARLEAGDAPNTPSIDVRLDFFATESFVEKS